MSMSRSKTPPPLSAKYPGSFAYPSMKDRVPVILSKIVDHLTRNKNTIVQQYGGEAARDELKSIIGAVSELRHNVMTNKPAKPLRDSGRDASIWNAQLDRQIKLRKEELERLNKETNEEESLRWFDDAWLWMECYLYRRVQEAVFMSNILKDYDVFGDQKREAFHNSFKPMSLLTMYLQDVIQKLERGASETDIKEYFTEFLQMSLWGNKCDLSISAGSVESFDHSPVAQLKMLEHKLVIDDSDIAYQVLSKAGQDKDQQVRVDIVLDNSAFELVTDLCLAELLLSSSLASKVVFHAKSMPWFVSDVTMEDWNWTLDMMARMNHLATSELSQRWLKRLNNGSWTVQVHDFWTLPNTYNEMKEISPELYSELSQSDFIIFKGDLNYRKLVSDRQWVSTTNFSRALRGFHPAPVCSLRTLKCDCIVGLAPGRSEQVEAEDEKWMVNGEWALVSVSQSISSS